MENIYKVKIRTNPDPKGMYPSERRYSASTVLGLGVIHLCFATLALIFASLSMLTGPYTPEIVSQLVPVNAATGSESKETLNYVFLVKNAETPTPQNETMVSDESFINKTIERRKKIVAGTLKSIPYAYLTVASVAMSAGALLSGMTALVAWKHWYIDNNIKWFFFASCISIIASCLSLAFTTVAVIVTFEKIHQVSRFLVAVPHFKLGLSAHVLIASFLEIMWSTLSARTAFRGMQNDYPNDIIVGKGRGKVEINTVRKGNGKIKIVPPDILNHFHVTERFAKYFPKWGESAYLPKAESNSEYQERVRKFLSSNIDASSVK